MSVSVGCYLPQERDLPVPLNETSSSERLRSINLWSNWGSCKDVHISLKYISLWLFDIRKRDYQHYAALYTQL